MGCAWNFSLWGWGLKFAYLEFFIFSHSYLLLQLLHVSSYFHFPIFKLVFWYYHTHIISSAPICSFIFIFYILIHKLLLLIFWYSYHIITHVPTLHIIWYISYFIFSLFVDIILRLLTDYKHLSFFRPVYFVGDRI